MSVRRTLSVVAVLVLVATGCTDRPPATTEPSGGSSGLSAEAGALPEEVRANGLVAGAEMVVPPMTFFAEDGTTPAGVNIDLAAALAEKLDTKITFEQYAFDGLQPALTSGKIDMIFDVINDTVERQEQMDFVDYVASGNTLLVADQNPHQIEGLEGLCGLRMATVRGSVQIGLIEEQSADCIEGGKDKIAIKQYPGAAEARLQVQHGRAGAFIGNTPVLLYVAKTAGEGGIFDAVPLPSTGAYYGIAFTKEDAAVRDAVAAALKELMADGTYAQILDKYGLADVAIDEPVINGATTDDD